jgi:hypothetical protein
MTGERAAIDIFGSDNTIQNLLMTGAKPEAGYSTAVLDRGLGNTLQFSTIVLDPNSPGHASALATINAATDTVLLGNIFDTPMAAIRQWFTGQGALQADFNLYAPDTRVILNTDQWLTMSQWQQMGFDVNTLLADPNFVDALGGDYRLADGFVAIDRLSAAMANLPQYDFAGNARPFGAGYDLGAFEAVPEPASAAMLVLIGAGAALRRQRRRTR